MVLDLDLKSASALGLGLASLHFDPDYGTKCKSGLKLLVDPWLVGLGKMVQNHLLSGGGRDLANHQQPPSTPLWT